MATARSAKRPKSAVDLETELDTLRQDITRVTEQLAQTATRKGREAATAVRDAAENVADSFEESMQERPLATLAIAVGLGFLLGAIWRK